MNQASGAEVRTLVVLDPIANFGTFKAADGKRLVLDAPQIDQDVDGKLWVENGGVIQINGALVTGGTAYTADCTSSIELIGGAEFDGVTIESDCTGRGGETVRVPDAQSGVLSGAITNDGGVRVAADVDITTLAPGAAGVTLSGTGKVVLDHEERAWFRCLRATITNESGHGIEGKGLLWGGVENQGEIRANAAGKTLTVSRRAENE